MKKFIYCLAITAIGTLTANAQDGERIFKKFKGDVSLGYARPTGSASSGGVLFAMEPKFAVMDNLALGLRIEAAVMARLTGPYGSGNTELDNAKAAASYVATADYYFTNNYAFRPFVGAGAGVFATAEGDSNYSDDITEVQFGGLFRAGAEIKHFRFGIEINLIPGSQASVYDYNAGRQVLLNIKNSYFGLKFGVCFGGGPR